MNRFTDTRVGSAATDVAGHRVIDILIGWLRLLAQQDGCTHELSGLAIAALRDVLFNPRLLQRMREIRRETFDGRHLFSGGATDRGNARADGFAIDVYRAGAALSHSASIL